ncbi:MAG: Sua5/YciO/YrdC/YwlC family protein [Bacteroidota bacterium]
MQNIQEAVTRLKQGQVISFYSEEGWVIGCDASNAAAADRLVAMKPAGYADPVTVLIGEIGQLQQFMEAVPEIAWDLVEFAEKPLTVIYPKGKNIAPSLLAADGRIAVRLAKETEGNPTVTQGLVRRFGRGLAVIPSSHSNAPTHINSSEVEGAISKIVDFSLDLNSKAVIKPQLSTLVRLEINGQITFLRR